MGADQYHEPPEELSAETRTFARMCASSMTKSLATILSYLDGTLYSGKTAFPGVAAFR